MKWIFSLLMIAGMASAQTKLANAPTLIVVHAQEIFDPAKAPKAEIDAYVALFKSRGHNVVYLERSKSEYTNDRNFKIGWYTEDNQPTQRFSSMGGEYRTRLLNNNFYFAGGFFVLFGSGVACVPTAMSFTIDNYFKTNPKATEVILNLPVGAMYHDSFASKAASVVESLQKDAANFIEYLFDEMMFTAAFHVPKGIEDHFEIKTGHTIPIQTPNSYYYKFIFKVDGQFKREVGIGKKRVVINFITTKLN